MSTLMDVRLTLTRAEAEALEAIADRELTAMYSSTKSPVPDRYALSLLIGAIRHARAAQD